MSLSIFPSRLHFILFIHSSQSSKIFPDRKKEMASPSLTTTAFFCLILTSMVSVFASSFQFNVGGKNGWTKPTGIETQNYNYWASGERERFHIGDSLYFKYNDSVLVMSKTSYKKCSVSNPIFKFEDGKTVFKFDRFGFFYFISGQPGHCRAGQRLIVQVMVHPAVNAPQSAPSPEESGSEERDD